MVPTGACGPACGPTTTPPTAIRLVAATPAASPGSKPARRSCAVAITKARVHQRAADHSGIRGSAGATTQSHGLCSVSTSAACPHARTWNRPPAGLARCPDRRRHPTPTATEPHAVTPPTRWPARGSQRAPHGRTPGRIRRQVAMDHLRDVRALDRRIKQLREAVAATGPHCSPSSGSACLGRPHPRRGRRRHPLRDEGALRLLQRHRPHRRVLRRADTTPALPGEQPAP
jgi:hypothetical protein